MSRESEILSQADKLKDLSSLTEFFNKISSDYYFDGYMTGKNEGRDNGHTDGYSKGLKEGYDDGYWDGNRR